MRATRPPQHPLFPSARLTSVASLPVTSQSRVGAGGPATVLTASGIKKRERVRGRVQPFLTVVGTVHTYFSGSSLMRPRGGLILKIQQEIGLFF